MTDGGGGRATVARQGDETIVQIQSDVEGRPLAEHFVIGDQHGVTTVHVGGDAPVLSLDLAEAVAHTTFVKGASQLIL
jgi:hypothetical protein